MSRIPDRILDKVITLLDGSDHSVADALFTFELDGDDNALQLEVYHCLEANDIYCCDACGTWTHYEDLDDYGHCPPCAEAYADEYDEDE